MNETEKSALKRNICLSALGMGLQLAGSICLFAATLGVVREVNLQIKKALLKEIAKQLEEK